MPYGVSSGQMTAVRLRVDPRTAPFESGTLSLVRVPRFCMYHMRDVYVPYSVSFGNQTKRTVLTYIDFTKQMYE